MKSTSHPGGGPKFVKFFAPVLEALGQLGGSARPPEVYDAIAKKLNVSDDAMSETLASGQTRFYNQVAWARFYLAKAGLLDTSRRGIWTLTEKGRAVAALSDAEALGIFRDVQSRFARDKREKSAVPRAGEAMQDAGEEDAPPIEAAAPEYSNHRYDALQILRVLPPAVSSSSVSAFYGKQISRKSP